MARSLQALRHTRHSLLLAAVVIVSLQGILAFSLSRSEYIPSPPPLSGFPDTLNQWQGSGDTTMDPEAYEMLAPDDYLNRAYVNRAGQTGISLFIAYYNSQHKAKGAHDPKVCLPGAGWNPLASKVIQIPVGQTAVSANHYVISKGSLKAVVIYWYQLHNRSVTMDEGLHFRRVLQTFGENRTDMALVRIVVPVKNDDVSTATDSALDFVRSAYPSIMGQFPPHASH